MQDQTHRDNVLRAIVQCLASRAEPDDLLVAEMNVVLADWAKLGDAINETVIRLWGDTPEQAAAERMQPEDALNRITDAVMVEYVELVSNLEADRDVVYRCAKALLFSNDDTTDAIRRVVAEVVVAQFRREAP